MDDDDGGDGVGDDGGDDYNDEDDAVVVRVLSPQVNIFDGSNALALPANRNVVSVRVLTTFCPLLCPFDDCIVNSYLSNAVD